ncbi:hypothetical protein RB601_006148 [Gaeumannomyces tritici]
MAPADQDPLLLLRQAIASGSTVLPTTAAEPSAGGGGGAAAPEASLSQATHMHFGLPSGAVSVAIDAPTRLISGDSPVDLRSIYFAWLNREASVTQYIEDANRLNEELQQAAAADKSQTTTTTPVRIYEFSKKVDLTTWLEGTNDRNELIKPLAEDEAAATAAAAAAGSASKGGAAAPAGAASGRSGRGTMDPRLAVVYSGERRMGDHNTALRGIKPTDFSHVRKLAAPFMIKKSSSGQHPSSGVGPGGQALPLNQKPQRRPDPIILLSPSASSLLRMSNIKSFLEAGRYSPPDHSSTASMLHISRTMRDIDPARPMRFILVEGPEQFKPEHWNRVVAVFTTGQAWQFKNYRWPQPADLFRHVAGVYVGWRDQPPPETVRAWGHRVQVHAIDKYREPPTAAAAAGLHNQADNSRFRDREVVESIWKGIEANMRSKGWQRDSGPTTV